MKKLIIAVVIVATIGGLGLYGGKVIEFFDTETVYIRGEAEKVIEVERVNELEVRVEEAVKSALPAIESEAKEKREKAEREAETIYQAKLAEIASTTQKFIETERKEVEDKVKAEYIAEIEATISSEAY